MPRHAFTLLELLVVLGIMLLVAAISMGVFFRSGDANRLVATERLVAGLVRQSVHQARTSGFPVSLVFSKDERSVTGINQSLLLTETFDGGTLPFDISARTNLGENQTVNWLGLGQTGEALVPFGQLDPTATGGAPIPPLATVLEKRLRLASRSSTRSDGFAVQIGVNVPDCATPPYQAMACPCLPLVLLSTDGTGLQAGLSASDDAPVGLFLWRREVHLFGDSGETVPTNAGGLPLNPTVPVWELIGWVQADTGARIYVSSLADSLSPQQNTKDIGLARMRRLGLPCGTWHDLALLWDGRSLTLLCDGTALASRAADGKHLATPAGISSTLSVWLGGVYAMGDLASYLQVPLGYPAVPPLKPEIVLPAAPGRPLLDNLRIAAVGEGQAGQLPRGIGPQQDATITVTPLGRVAVNGGSSTASQMLTFVGDFEKADQQAEITVNGDGTVAGRLIMGSH